MYYDEKDAQWKHPTPGTSCTCPNCCPDKYAINAAMKKLSIPSKDYTLRTTIHPIQDGFNIPEIDVVIHAGQVELTPEELSHITTSGDKTTIQYIRIMPKIMPLDGKLRDMTDEEYDKYITQPSIRDLKDL
jgi:hypothetical protein